MKPLTREEVASWRGAGPIGLTEERLLALLDRAEKAEAERDALVIVLEASETDRETLRQKQQQGLTDWTGLRAERDAMAGQLETATASEQQRIQETDALAGQVAALSAGVVEVLAYFGARWLGGQEVRDRLTSLVVDTEAAAREHDARARDAALEEAAKAVDFDGWPVAAEIVRALKKGGKIPKGHDEAHDRARR